MAYIPLEDLMKKNKSVFRLVLATAERANEINKGAQPLVQTASKSPATVALEEFAQGKVYYERVQQPVQKPEIPQEDQE